MTNFLFLVLNASIIWLIYTIVFRQKKQNIIVALLLSFTAAFGAINSYQEIHRNKELSDNLYPQKLDYLKVNYTAKLVNRNDNDYGIICLYTLEKLKEFNNIKDTNDKKAFDSIRPYSKLIQPETIVHTIKSNGLYSESMLIQVLHGPDTGSTCWINNIDENRWEDIHQYNN